MDQSVDRFLNTCTLFDDILVVTKNTKVEHWEKVKKFFWKDWIKLLFV